MQLKLIPDGKFVIVSMFVREDIRCNSMGSSKDYDCSGVRMQDGVYILECTDGEIIVIPVDHGSLLIGMLRNK